MFSILNAIHRSWFKSLVIILISFFCLQLICSDYILLKKSKNLKPLLKVEYQRLLNQKIAIGFDKLGKNELYRDSLKELIFKCKLNHQGLLIGDSELLLKPIQNKKCKKFLKAQPKK